MKNFLRLKFDNKFLKKYRATLEILCISGYTWNDIRSDEKSKLGDIYALLEVNACCPFPPCRGKR